MNGSIEISTLLAYLGLGSSAGAVLVLILTQLIKKFGKYEGFVIHSLSFALGVALAAAQYAIQVHGKLPIAIPGISAFMIYGVAQFVFKNGTYLKPILSRVQINLAPAAPLQPISGVAPAVDAAPEQPAAPPAVAQPEAEPAVATNGEFEG